MDLIRFARPLIGMTAAALALAACSGGSGSSITPVSQSGQHPPVPPTQIWTQYYYNSNDPSGPLLHKRASYSGGTSSFTFYPSVFTAQLTTKEASLIGNLTGDTLSDTITVSGATSQFTSQYYGCYGASPNARFFFSSGGNPYLHPKAEWHYWWSNPVSFTLANGSATISQALTDPSAWSDFFGHFGSANPEEFYNSVSAVKYIGLSFGGGCFFENGATVYSGSALLQSQFTETPSSK